MYLIYIIPVFIKLGISMYEIYTKQVMVTPSFYIEDRNGIEITYKEYIEKMNSVQFIPANIQIENSEQLNLNGSL